MSSSLPLPSLPLLALLLSSLLLLLLPVSHGQTSCSLYDLIDSSGARHSRLAPNCSDVVGHGASCTVLPAACGMGGSGAPAQAMVLETLCADGIWIWPDKPQFCPGWAGCSFTPPASLSCVGPSAFSNYPRHLPFRLDPRLTSVSVTHYPTMVTYETTTYMPKVEYLNLSHNAITTLPNFSLQQRTLRVLDLSYNDLTMISSFTLPTFGALDHLDLGHNPIRSYDALALKAAMGRCSRQTNATTLIESMTLRAPFCSLELLTGVVPHTGRDKLDQCVIVTCDVGKQPSPVTLQCRKMTALGVDFSLDKRCNQLAECLDSSDEDLCGGYLDLISATSHPPGGVDLCDVIVGYIAGSYSIHHGLLSIPMTTQGRAALSGIAAIIFSLWPEAPPAQISSPDGVLNNTVAQITMTENIISLDVIYSLKSVPGVKSTCTLVFETSPNMTETTGAATVSGATSSSPPRNTVASPEKKEGGVVAGCLAAFLLIVGLGYVAWRRRRARFFRRRLDLFAPKTPQHLIDQVGKIRRDALQRCSALHADLESRLESLLLLPPRPARPCFACSTSDPLPPCPLLIFTTSPSSQAQEQFVVQYASVFGADVCHRDWEDAYNRRRVTIDDLEMTQTCLGEGFSGKVYLARLHAPALFQQPNAEKSSQSLEVALKVIARASGGQPGQGSDQDAVVRCALLEARLHARLDHPNLVRLLAVQEARQPVMLALELCSRGALLGLLRERSGGELDFNAEQRRDMATQVAAGVRYLHSKLCIHRDIAARNVLVAEVTPQGEMPTCGYVLKLSDLGLARQLRTESDYYRTKGQDEAVPIRWQCPEAILGQVYTAKSDVYSFGVLLYEIYSGGATPHGNLAASEVLKMVRAGERLGRPSTAMDEEVFALMRVCTSLYVNQRPSMASVLARLLGTWTLEPQEGRPLPAGISLNPGMVRMESGGVDGLDNDSETAL